MRSVVSLQKRIVALSRSRRLSFSDGSTLDAQTVGRPRAAAQIARAVIVRYFRALSMISAVAVLLIVWTVVGPSSLGGQSSYVITDGVSMLPKFHAGDLVVLHKEATYHVGEVAAYYNGQLGVVVMHRIIAINDGHYEFKGDNNNFVDSFQPTKSEIVGAEVMHVPGAGRLVEKLKDPVAAAVLLGMLWMFAFAPRPTTRRQRRRHRHAH